MGSASAACFQITVQNRGITARLCHALNWRAWLFPGDDKRGVRISAHFLFSFKSFTSGRDLLRSGCCFSSPLHAAQCAAQCCCSCCRYPSGWLARGSCAALPFAAARPPVGVCPASSCAAAHRPSSHCAARARSVTSLCTQPVGTAAQLATLAAPLPHPVSDQDSCTCVVLQLDIAAGSLELSGTVLQGFSSHPPNLYMSTAAPPFGLQSALCSRGPDRAAWQEAAHPCCGV